MVVNYNIYIHLYICMYISVPDPTAFLKWQELEAQGPDPHLGEEACFELSERLLHSPSPCIIFSGSNYYSVFTLFLNFILFTAGSFTVILNCVNSKWFSNIVFFPDFFLMHINEVGWCWVKSQWNKNQRCLQGSFSFLFVDSNFPA